MSGHCESKRCMMRGIDASRRFSGHPIAGLHETTWMGVIGRFQVDLDLYPWITPSIVPR